MSHFNGCWRRARHSGMRCGHAVLAVVLLLVLGPVSVQAADQSASPPYSSLFVQETLSRAGAACANAPEGSASTDCLVDQALNKGMEEFSRFASERGRSLFGDNFRIVNRLSLSPSGTGLDGDIDTVFPLSFGTALGPVSTAPDGPRTGSDALFLQWGVSRWTDDNGMRRDDARYGLVRRFALSDTPGADVVGVSALLQRRLESSHERLVIGLDYAGSWGHGWFHHYTPTTGWRPGRSGFQERALEGAELGLRLTPTTTIGLETALTRWEDKDGSGEWRTGARVGLDWRPHPWLSFRTAWEDVGDGDGSASFGVRFSIPLGGGRRERPRWEGLGLAGTRAGSEANAPDIWRPLDNVRPIEVAERAIPSPSSPAQSPSPQATNAEECRAGQTVRPGESCVYPGTDLEFTVLASGSGRLGFFTSGRSLNIVNTTINGQRITFVANRQDDGSWLIERVGDSASGNVPDLSVGSASVSDSSPDAGASFTLSATVRNAGDGRSAATTLRYYRSSDATISTSDTAMGTDAVGGLAASGTSAESISLTAPSTAGTYYYGACVDTVSGESDTSNNCSDAVTLTVLSGDRPGDTAPHFTDTVPAQTYTAGTIAHALTLPAATGGDGALTYTLAPAVPGLSFDAATRRLSGRPTQEGAYRVTYRADDADANTADSDAAIHTFTITVQAAGDFAPRMYNTVFAQTYTAGTAIFALRLPTAYGGNGALTYTLAPAVPGLSFDAATRHLSGTPTQAGTYRMTYRADDADANTGDSDAAIRTFTITVQAAGDFAPRMYGTVAAQTYTAGTAIVPLRLLTAYGGNGALTYTLTPTVPGLSFDAATRRLSGTPAQAGAYRMTYRADDADANTGDSDAAIRTFTITVQATPGGVPDLAVGSPSVSDGSPDAGASFTLSATVRNRGNGRSAATTLRYYRSSDVTITTGDTAVGTDAVGALAASGTSAESISLTAPSTAGTYYYGVCVDTVSGESDTSNNCSDAVTLTVLSGDRPGDTAPHFTDTVPAQTYTAGTIAHALTLPAATGGDGALTYTLAPAVPGLSFDAATRRLSGRPTQEGAYRVTYRADDADANTADSDAAIHTFTITVQAAGDFAPRMYNTVFAQTYTAGTAIFALRLPTAYGGNGALTYTLAPAVPGLSFDAATRHLSGTPTQAGTYRMTYRADDADANTGDSDAAIRTFTITVQAAGDFAPRMYGTVAAQTYTAGTAIVPLRLLTAYGGNGALTYTLTPTVPGLSFDAATRRLSGTPAQAGAYRMTYRADDADANTGDSDAAIRTFTITVQATPGGVPDLAVGSPSVSDGSPDAGASFTLSATVRNRGNGRSAATTLRYYRSSDVTITTGDTAVGTDAVGALAASGTSSESISLTAPSSAGTYYYGACVDTVSGEADTTNNCSTGVPITVSGGSTFAPANQAAFDARTVGKRALSDDSSNYKDFVSAGRFREVEGDDVYMGRYTYERTGPNSGRLAFFYDGGGRCTSNLTYESATTGASTYSCSDGSRGTTNWWLVDIPTSNAPDLAVGSPSVSDASPDAGTSLTLRATVRNAGDGRSAATTLRYYRSSDATISTSDTAVGTDAVGGLAASGTSAESISLTAPSSAGTYYYGACVDTVSGESDTANNCSSAVRVTVSNGASGGNTFGVGSALPGVPTSGIFIPAIVSGASVSASGGATTIAFNNSGYIELQDGTRYTCRAAGGCQVRNGVVTRGTIESGGGGTPPPSSGPDLAVGSPSVSDASPDAGASLTLRATVRNGGDGRSAATTLRYYRSSDATISTSDTAVGTDAVGGLAASGTSAESISLTAPSSAGTYYYGACVDTVSGESNTANNCSSAVRVTVTGTPPAKAVTGQITECSGTSNGLFITVTIRGTVQAHRAVSFVTISGYANGSSIGVDLLGSMSAGQTKNFNVGGILSGTASRLSCRVQMEWTELGNQLSFDG